MICIKCLIYNRNNNRDSVGVWTIGYGTTYYENGSKVKKGDTITAARASDLLKYFVNKFATGVDSSIGSGPSLKQQQFDALVSFSYNLGLGNLKSSTLLSKVKANPNDSTIRAEFMKWNKAGGKVLAGLTRRRQAEADLYFS